MNNYWSINPWLPDTDLIDLDMNRKAAKGCALNLTQENECIFVFLIFLTQSQALIVHS